MKTSAVEATDLTRSVLSVPPLCRRADFAIDREQNILLLAHLRAGGVSIFMYGGNANLYNMAPSEFALFCELVQDIAQSGDWIIPSVGSDYGKAAISSRSSVANHSPRRCCCRIASRQRRPAWRRASASWRISTASR
jgi:hypothetical protein